MQIQVSGVNGVGPVVAAAGIFAAGYVPSFERGDMHVNRSMSPQTVDFMESYPGNNYWVADPVRRGPQDRQTYESAGWYYDEVSMDAHSFLSVNSGRLSLRGIPMVPGQDDKWETPMSSRSQVQYWFHARQRQEPAGSYIPDMTIRVWTSSQYQDHQAENYVSPTACDTCLWDFQILSCPPGSVTIAIWRPLRRGHLAAGWWREGNWNPTNKDFPRAFSHKPQAQADWLPDNVGSDKNPPIDHDEL